MGCSTAGTVPLEWTLLGSRSEDCQLDVSFNEQDDSILLDRDYTLVCVSAWEGTREDAAAC